MRDDFITIREACRLLSVSRPTFNKYRKRYQLRPSEIYGRLYFSKLELIENILYQNPIIDNKEIKLTALDNNDFSSIIAGANIFDLRKNITLDAFAAISLLCTLKEIIRNQNQAVYLLVDDNDICCYLKSIGFFRELERSNTGKVFYRKDIIPDDPRGNSSIILPLHLIGYRGAEKKIMEELYDGLLNQGFSEDLSSYLGWIMGELSDNSMTHAKGGPCYLMIEAKHNEEIKYKFLSFVIGDIGCGIPSSLKSNSKYSTLDDKMAFVSAFFSNVSSWGDEHQRGKGLNDILGISIGNGSWVRAESNNIGFFANFIEDKNNINWINPLTSSDGTRIVLILIDNEFKDVRRENVNKILKNFMGHK